jgi:hypothetical protein
MADEKPRIAEELSKMKEEPILPIEKQLIVYSLLLGVVLLVVFAWISFTFFNVQP